MEGSGEKAGAATKALPHSSPAGGGSSSAGERSPLKFPHTLLWVIPGTRSRPPIPASFSGAGRQDGGPQGGTEGQEPPGQFTVGTGKGGRGGQGAPCRPGDIGGRAAGCGVFRYQIPAGSGPESRGPGQGQSPWWGWRGPGSGRGTRPQSWLLSAVRAAGTPSRLALGPVPGVGGLGVGGQRPQYGLRPESEQRTARADSLQSRWPRGRQPLPRFLCLWHCLGVRIYWHFSRE